MQRQTGQRYVKACECTGEMCRRVEWYWALSKTKPKTNLKVILTKRTLGMFKFQEPELQYSFETLTKYPLAMVIIFFPYLFWLVCKQARLCSLTGSCYLYSFSGSSVHIQIHIVYEFQSSGKKRHKCLLLINSAQHSLGFHPQKMPSPCFLIPIHKNETKETSLSKIS